MPYVEVTFKMEVSDPDDSTGLSEEDFNDVLRAVSRAGGYDFEPVLEVDDDI